MSTPIAITGAAGHIGRALIDRLGPSTPIRAIDRAPRPIGIGGNVEWVRGDVRDRPALSEAFAGVRTVFHLAAVITISPGTADTAWDVNVNGAESAARAALDAGVTRFVHCSSIHAFDCSIGKGPIHEDSARSIAEHLPLYDRSKAAGEQRVRAVRDDGLDVVVVHPAGVIGPGDHVPSLMGNTFRRVIDGSLPGVVGAPFEWIDVRDVAIALEAAAVSGVSGRSYLLSGHHVGLDRLTRMMAEMLGLKPPPSFPLWLASLAAKTLPKFPQLPAAGLVTPDAITALRYSRHVDDQPAQTDLGHRPRPIEETMADIVAWLRQTEPSHGDRDVLRTGGR